MAGASGQSVYSAVKNVGPALPRAYLWGEKRRRELTLTKAAGCEFRGRVLGCKVCNFWPPAPRSQKKPGAAWLAPCIEHVRNGGGALGVKPSLMGGSESELTCLLP